MRYWLFLIMKDKQFSSELWKRFLKDGIAAQHYPETYYDKGARTRNVRLLKQLQPGDAVLATFRGHKFGGHGMLHSSLKEGAKSLNIYDYNGDLFDFRERFDCEWTAMNPDQDPCHVDCKELAVKGVKTKLDPYACVTEIDEESYLAIVEKLNSAGANPIHYKERTPPGNSGGVGKSNMDSEGTEQGRPIPPGILKPEALSTSGTQYTRSSAVEEWILENANGRCEVCLKEAPFFRVDGTPYLEIHHMKQLSRGGSDTVNNTIAVCPNCHRELHYGESATELLEMNYGRIVRLVRE